MAPGSLPLVSTLPLKHRYSKQTPGLSPSTHKNCAEHYHFEGTLTRSNLGKEESYFSSEIHDVEGTAAGPLALEEAYHTARYSSTNQEAKTDRKRGRAPNAPRDGLPPAKAPRPKVSAAPKTEPPSGEHVLRHKYVGDALHLSHSARHLGVLFGHLQLKFLFLTHPCWAATGPQVSTVW